MKSVIKYHLKKKELDAQDEAQKKVKKTIKKKSDIPASQNPLTRGPEDVMNDFSGKTFLPTESSDIGNAQVNIMPLKDIPDATIKRKWDKSKKAKPIKGIDYDVEKGYVGSEMSINKGYWNHKVMIGHPMTGVLRAEWVLARYGQIIPTNWSMMDSYQPLPMQFAPMKYLVPDAQNVIVKHALDRKVEWVFLVEQDNVLPPDCFIRMNEYMRKADTPIISGLYFTKSVPPEPMIYRGVGNSFYRDWKLGERVWCTGLPTGCVIIHSSVLQAVWDEAPEYKVGDVMTRRVFETPEKVWYDPQTAGYRTEVGTSDLNFCNKLMDPETNFLEKAGWSKHQKMDNPFLVDTNIFVKHIDMDGRMFPLEMPEEYFPVVKPRDNGKH